MCREVVSLGGTGVAKHQTRDRAALRPYDAGRSIARQTVTLARGVSHSAGELGLDPTAGPAFQGSSRGATPRSLLKKSVSDAVWVLAICRRDGQNWSCLSIMEGPCWGALTVR